VCSQLTHLSVYPNVQPSIHPHPSTYTLNSPTHPLPTLPTMLPRVTQRTKLPYSLDKPTQYCSHGLIKVLSKLMPSGYQPRRRSGLSTSPMYFLSFLLSPDKKLPTRILTQSDPIATVPPTSQSSIQHHCVPTEAKQVQIASAKYQIPNAKCQNPKSKSLKHEA